MTATTLTQPPDLLKMLAHELRWQIVNTLAGGDLRVGEIIAFLGQPANLVSYHLRLLRQHGLVAARRSDADGRDMYYRLNLSRLQSEYLRAGEQLHPALHVDLGGLPPAEVAGSRVPRILFVCTHNSARSQMAEALLRRRVGGAVSVASAGSHPAQVHPMAIQVMSERGIDIRHQHSKGFEAFVGQSFDTVITVCDRAREVCPVFPDHPDHVHWSLPDPSSVEGKAARLQAFEATADQLAERIGFFVSQLGESSEKSD